MTAGMLGRPPPGLNRGNPRRRPARRLPWPQREDQAQRPGRDREIARDEDHVARAGQAAGQRPAARMVTGHVLAVDGGFLAQ